MEEDESWECVEEEERVWVVEKEKTRLIEQTCLKIYVNLNCCFIKKKKKLAFWNWKIAQENELCRSLCLL